MKKSVKWLLGIIITLIALLSLMLMVVKSKTYQPSPDAKIASQNSTMVGNTIKFPGDKDKPRVIFYPGALVEPKSYSIWANNVAQAGYSVYIVHFPLDLAVLKINAAADSQNNQDYVIGGHSLGGTMACRYAKRHSQKLKGVFLLASYPEKKGDLHEINVPVLSLTASDDGVLNRTNYKKAKKLLPNNAVYEQISGGNHAGFGSYGEQSGDNKASITDTEQQIIISRLLINWLDHTVSE